MKTIEYGGTVWNYYNGTGTIDSILYDCYLSHRTTGTDNFDLTICNPGADPVAPINWMDFEGTYTSRNPVSGACDGTGTYSANTGTFTATQQ